MKLPEGWATTTLGDCQAQTSTIDPRREPEREFDLFSVPSYSGYTPDRAFGAEIGSAKQSVQPGDVLLCKIVPHIRRGWVVPLPGERRQIASGEWIVFRNHPLEPEFLRRFVLSDGFHQQFMLTVSGVGGSLMRARPVDAAKIRVPLPPLAEQRRIVAKLDALTARLARARAELDRVQALGAQFRTVVKASAYEGELTRDCRGDVDANWTVRSLHDIAEVVTGSTPPTAEKSALFGGSLAFFKPTDLNAGYYVDTPRQTLSEAGAERARVVPAGTTLVTCIGATISKTGLARVDCAFNQQINGVIPKTGVAEPRWLYWAITSPVFRSSIIDNASATTMPIINKGRFQALTLPVPPFVEQRQIADRLEAAFTRADRLEAEAARARALLDRLESAILAKAFRGELVPQDPNDEPASVLLDRIRAQRAAAPKPKRSKVRPQPEPAA